MPLLCAYLGSLKLKNSMHCSEICAHTFMNSGPWCCLLNQFGYFSTEYIQKIAQCFAYYTWGQVFCIYLFIHLFNFLGKRFMNGKGLRETK
jgi:hypothetical protein